MTKISCNVTKIAEEVSEVFNGRLLLKNTGGGLLSGNITSDSDIISFSENDFEGNELEVNYCINVRNFIPKKLIKFNIFIISNGGEITIPVFIKVLKNILYTKDGYKINNIKDFFSYFKKKPENAADIFFSEVFYEWLVKTGFEHIYMINMFLKDNIKERAIDNFFIFCKLKKKAFVEVIEKNINISIKPFQTEKILGSIVILKKGYGYIHRELKSEYYSEWLSIKKNEITSKDFNDENRCYIDFEINPGLINGSFSCEFIIVDENTYVRINVSRLPKIVVKLSEEIYDFEDSGYVFIQNNCGENLIFEFSAKDGFIEFENKRRVISDKEKVYFKIKRSKMKSFMERVSFNKRLYSETEIYVKTVFQNKVIKKTKKVILGASLL